MGSPSRQESIHRALSWSKVASLVSDEQEIRAVPTYTNGTGALLKYQPSQLPGAGCSFPPSGLRCPGEISQTRRRGVKEPGQQGCVVQCLRGDVNVSTQRRKESLRRSLAQLADEVGDLSSLFDGCGDSVEDSSVRLTLHLQRPRPANKDPKTQCAAQRVKSMQHGHPNSEKVERNR